MRIKAFTKEAEIQLSELLNLLGLQKLTVDLKKAYPVPAEFEQIPFPSPRMFSNMLHVFYDREFSSKVVNQKVRDNGFLRITSSIENYIQSFKIFDESNFKIGETAIENLLKFGVTNAYDWEIANWGANAMENLTIVNDESDYFCCAFLTQPDSISQWIIKVSKDFPLLNFSLASELPPDRCIVKDINNGVLIESSDRTIWSTLN